MGARRLVTASSAIATPMLLAVAPLTHPPQVKPTIRVATIQPAHAQNTAVFVGRDSLKRWLKLRGLLESMCSPSIGLIAGGVGDNAELHGPEFRRADEAGLVDLGPPRHRPISNIAPRRRCHGASPAGRACIRWYPRAI